MKIFIAGKGNIGTALSSFLARKNIFFTVLDFGWEETKPTEGVLFLALPDDSAINAIENYYTEVPDNLKIIYFAGGRPVEKKGVFLFHPYASISKETNLEEIYFSLWKKDESVEILLKRLGFKVVSFNHIPTTGYHTSAVFAGNFSQFLLLTGKALLLKEGFCEADAEKFLYQLLSTSLENVFQNSLKGITGPAARNDSETEKKEIEFLQNNCPADFSELYEKFSGMIKKAVKNDDLF